MPFTGAGTGIQNADDIFFSALTQDNVLRYNSTTAKWNNVAISIGASDIANEAVTEPKLAVSNSPANNQFLRWNGTALEWATLSYEAAITAGTTAQYWRGDKTWQTLDKTVVGLANVDNTSDATKNAAAATLTNKTISGSANTLSNIPQSAVTDLATDLAGKLALSTATAKGDLLVATAAGAVTRLGVGTNNHVLTADSSQAAGVRWAPVSGAFEPAITAGTTAQYWRGDKTWQTLDKTVVGLANVDNTSDATKDVLSASRLSTARTINGVSFDGTANITIADNTKVPTSRTVTGVTSLAGGGDLSADRTISLVNDAAAPGNSKYYGTDGSGAKGYHDIPSGDPTMGGDLSGTASNAQIAAEAVGNAELASSAVTNAKIANGTIAEPKLAVANAPATGQVLSWNGSDMAWAGALAFAFTRVDVTSATYTVPSTFTYVFADATAQGITITLPAPANNAYVRVKRMNGNANGVQVVAPSGSYIDAAGVGSDVLNNQYDSQEYWSDGSNWYR